MSPPAAVIALQTRRLTSMELATPTRHAYTDRMTAGGFLAFMIGLMLFGSAIPALRVSVLGPSLHPYFFLLPISLAYSVLRPDRSGVRRGLQGAGIMLLIGLAVSGFAGPRDSDTTALMAKWIGVAATFAVVERLIRTEKDVSWATAGLIIGVTAIGVRGLVLYHANPSFYVQVLPGIGSRNAFSFWTISPVVLSLQLIASSSSRTHTKAVLGVMLAAVIVPQVLSLNRAGWITLALAAGLTVALRRSARVLIVVLLVGFALQTAISQFGFADKLEDRWEDLRTGTNSDAKRLEVIVAGLVVFAKNPLLGVSQASLPFEVAREMRGDPISSHNLAIELLAGTGLAGTVPFVVLIILLLRRWMAARRSARSSAAASIAATMPILLGVAGVRSMTGNEIVFNPSLVVGIAVAYAAAGVVVKQAGSGREEASRRAERIAIKPGQRPGRAKRLLDVGAVTKLPAKPE